MYERLCVGVLRFSFYFQAVGFDMRSYVKVEFMLHNQAL